MPESRPLPDANVRAKTYYVARTQAKCSHCGLQTRLLALAMPYGHETLDEDAPGAWHRAGFNAFLFFVERLSDEVQSRLSGMSQSFRLADCAATLSSYWANHCEHCGALLGDHELHCEFDCAFMPSSESSAADIELLKVREPLQALAAGYAIEPEYFRFMSRS
ncbi:MAG: hypothetical protein WA803_13195 [Steroidobacteraceae bacterium]